MNTKVIEEKRHFVHNKIIIGLNKKFDGLGFSNFSLGCTNWTIGTSRHTKSSLGRCTL